MVKKLFVAPILASFIALLALAPAFANDGSGDIVENGASVDIQATGCTVSLPASVTKGAMLQIWVNSTGGTFTNYNAKVVVKWPTTVTGFKYKATYKKKVPSVTSGISIQTWTPGWAGIGGGNVTVKATVKEGGNTHKCSASAPVL